MNADNIKRERERERTVLFNDTLNTFYLRLYGVSNKPINERRQYQVLITGNCDIRKEGNVLFIDALSTFCLRLYGIRHMVKDHSDSVKGNLLLPLGLLFPISSKASFICIIP